MRAYHAFLWFKDVHVPLRLARVEALADTKRMARPVAAEDFQEADMFDRLLVDYSECNGSDCEPWVEDGWRILCTMG